MCQEGTPAPMCPRHSRHTPADTSTQRATFWVVQVKRASRRPQIGRDWAGFGRPRRACRRRAHLGRIHLFEVLGDMANTLDHIILVEVVSISKPAQQLERCLAAGATGGLHWDPNVPQHGLPECLHDAGESRQMANLHRQNRIEQHMKSGS